MSYPQVRDEFDTMRRVVAGASLARYGDGEFKHCAGNRNVSQEYHPALAQRLRDILLDSGACMVGIPNIHSDTPKADFWRPFQDYARFLAPGRQYGSSFVTRPDSAPWINTPEYWRQVESLWLGQDVTLVRGSSKGLLCDDLVGAGQVREIVSTPQGAFAEYDRLIDRIGRPKRALLCLGPCATVLAVDLCARGVHAIDLGHIALFVRKFRRGEPMTLSKKEKAYEKAQGVSA